MNKADQNQSRLQRLEANLKWIAKSVLGPSNYRILCQMRQRIQTRRAPSETRQSETKLGSLHRYFEYDFQRFSKHSSGVSGPVSKKQWQAILTIDSHKIEKALSLKEPKLGFGMAWLDSYTDNIAFYLEHFGADQTVEFCFRALQDYIQFHLRAEYPIDHVESLLKRLQDKSGVDIVASGFATRKVTWDEVKKTINIDFAGFVASRHSIRNFLQDPVERSIIEDAISIASKTPSVCNRQGWFVYAYDSQPVILELLKHQRGNAGFSEQIATLLLITSDLSAMHDPVERFQPWIDGGMYSMSLIYALHSMGLGTCCLNLSISSDDDLALRETARIREEHSPVMMIAIGRPPPSFQVATSNRKDINQVLQWSMGSASPGTVELQ